MQKVLEFLKSLKNDPKKMIIAIVAAVVVIAGIIVAIVFGVKNYKYDNQVVYVDEDTGEEYTQSDIDAIAEWWAGVQVGQEGDIEVSQ